MYYVKPFSSKKSLRKTGFFPIPIKTAPCFWSAVNRSAASPPQTLGSHRLKLPNLAWRDNGAVRFDRGIGYVAARAEGIYNCCGGICGRTVERPDIDVSVEGICMKAGEIAAHRARRLRAAVPGYHVLGFPYHFPEWDMRAEDKSGTRHDTVPAFFEEFYYPAMYAGAQRPKRNGTVSASDKITHDSQHRKGIGVQSKL
jgi:hypothetical protein